MQKKIEHIITSPEELDTIDISLQKGDRIFFYGDLGAGKTTFIRSILRKHFLSDDLIVRSPTYTYFQKYGENVYHFDLFRIEDEETFFLIGAEDIWNNPDTICLIEWPERIEHSRFPTISVRITKSAESNRKIVIEYKN